jgi:4-hydroxy-3-methylbut-2-enyl diphosphate reductase IspH
VELVEQVQHALLMFIHQEQKLTLQYSFVLTTTCIQAAAQVVLVVVTAQPVHLVILGLEDHLEEQVLLGQLVHPELQVVQVLPDQQVLRDHKVLLLQVTQTSFTQIPEQEPVQ